jgi:hypothetical protein
MLSDFQAFCTASAISYRLGVETSRTLVKLGGIRRLTGDKLVRLV